MRYLGGKSRIANQIASVLSNEIAFERERERERESNFVSLFCGSCSIESKVIADNKICNDKHEYLIEMWKALQNGRVFPEQISEEQYKYIREHKDEDKALTGFVGFGCSFAGKWFGGYARARKENRTYASESKNGLERKIKGLQTTKFTCLDYRDVEIPDGAVVYCDPPYANTTGFSVGKFDFDDFWNYMREISKTHKVFISEQTAPDDFECIWEKQLLRQTHVDTAKHFAVTEKLFVYKG